MNRTQLIILWVGIGIFVLMGLFPPWMAANLQGGNYVAAGFGFILLPPSFKFTEGSSLESYWRCRIDSSQLICQWAIVAVVTAGLIYTLKDKKKD